LNTNNNAESGKNIPWHRLLGLTIEDLFTGSPYVETRHALSLQRRLCCCPVLSEL